MSEGMLRFVFLVGGAVFLLYEHPVMFWLVALPIAIVVAVSILADARKRKKSILSLFFGRSRGRQKSFLGLLIDGQKQTERRNNSHRGVMCSPGGSRRK